MPSDDVPSIHLVMSWIWLTVMTRRCNMREREQLGNWFLWIARLNWPAKHPIGKYSGESHLSWSNFVNSPLFIISKESVKRTELIKVKLSENFRDRDWDRHSQLDLLTSEVPIGNNCRLFRHNFGSQYDLRVKKDSWIFFKKIYKKDIEINSAQNVTFLYYFVCFCGFSWAGRCVGFSVDRAVESSFSLFRIVILIQSVLVVSIKNTVNEFASPQRRTTSK